MDSKMPLWSTCAEQIYKDMFTPTYCQCFVLQSQALPASSATGLCFLVSVPLASIPSTALIRGVITSRYCLQSCAGSPISIILLHKFESNTVPGSGPGKLVGSGRKKHWLIPYSNQNVSCPENDVGHPRFTDNNIAEKWPTPLLRQVKFRCVNQKVLRFSLSE